MGKLITSRSPSRETAPGIPVSFYHPPSRLGGVDTKSPHPWLIGKVITFPQRPNVQCISNVSPLAKTGNNWLCPSPAPLELDVICKAHNGLKRQSVASFCLPQTRIPLTRPTPTPAPPPRRLLFPESHPRACQITYFIAWRQKAIWSSWSPLSVGRRSQGLLPGPRLRITPHQPSPFIPPSLPPASALVPGPLSLGSGFLVLAEQCGLSACIKRRGKRHNFRRLKAYRFFIWFYEPDCLSWLLIYLF